MTATLTAWTQRFVPIISGALFCLLLGCSDTETSEKPAVVPDTSAPVWAAGAELSSMAITATSIQLAWPPAQDNVGVVTYRVFNGNEALVDLGSQTTRFLIGKLMPATSYLFRVEAMDKAGNVTQNPLSGEFSTVDESAPDWPIDAEMTATDVGLNHVEVSWSPASDDVGVVGYQVYVNDVIFAEVDGSITTFKATQLEAVTEYSFHVTADDAAGNRSGQGPSLVVSTVDKIAPAWSDSSELLVSEVTETELMLGWTAAKDNVGIQGYRVFQGTLELTDKPTSETSYKVTGLSSWQQYKFTVKALDVSGNESADELSLSVKTPDNTVPVFASGALLQASELTATSVMLNWSAAVATDNTDIFAYRIYQDNVLKETVDSSMLHVTGLKPWSTYTFRVEALDPAGNESKNGPAVEIATIDDQAPVWPSNSQLMASNVTETSLVLGWTAADDNVGIAGYRVYGGDAELTSQPVQSPTFVVDGLKPWQDYSFSVHALDKSGNQTVTALKVAVKTKDTTAPSFAGSKSIALTNVTGTSVSLNWAESVASDNAAVVGYRVYRDGVLRSTTAGMAYSDTELEQWTKYTFRVEAVDAAGHESTNGPSGTVTTLDEQAPSWPEGGSLSASDVTETSLWLGWPKATDNTGSITYRVFQGAQELTPQLGTANTSYKVEGLKPWQEYSFSVMAADESGNTTANAMATKVQTKDITAPSFGAGAILNFTKVTASGVHVDWWAYAATDNALVASYRVYQNNVLVSTVSSPQVKLSQLAPYTTYTIRVEALDAAGNESNNGPLGQVTTKDSDLPSWPNDGQLIATDVGETSLVLAWSKATDDVGVLGYRVFNGFEELTGKPLAKTALKVTGLAPWQEYDFSVVAVDMSGNETADSLTLTVQTKDMSAPKFDEEPKLNFSQLSSTGVQIEWWSAVATDNVGLTGYRVYQDNVLVATVKKAQVVVSNLSPWSTYVFRIEAIDGAGNESNDGPQGAVKTLDEVSPLWPEQSELTASQVSGSSLLLGWTMAIDDVAVASYKIYQDDVLVKTVEKMTDTAISKLDPGTTYSFRVEALDLAGNESEGGPETTVSTAAITAPGWPAGSELVAENIKPSSLTLSWTKAVSTDGVARYVVYQDGVKIADLDDAQEWIVKALSPGATYLFKVEAESVLGPVSLDGPSIEVTTPDLAGPSWPQTSKLEASDVSHDTVTLHWTAATDDVGVAGYRVYEGGVLVKQVDHNTLTLVVPQLSAQTQYTFRVEAGDAAGNWSANGPQLIVTTLEKVWTTQAVFEAMKVQCASCHYEGSSSSPNPFFDSISKFDELIVNSSKFVIAGSPESSEFVMLLKGKGTNYAQMPPYGDSFETMGIKGQTKITVEEVESWIKALPQ